MTALESSENARVDGVFRDNNDSSYVAMETAAQQKMNDNDDEDDNLSISPSLVSSVLTAEGIHDYTGFLCVCLVILIGDMSRGVMFPSLWPLVQSLGGTEVFQGYTVAAFSFGRIISNPIFGSLSHTHGYTNSLLLSCSILCFGTLLYAQIPVVGRLDFLIISQTVLGMGSGTLGVTRAFVADVTAKRNRTTYMAWATAVQYTGFTVFPVVGAIFNKLFDGRSYPFLGILQFNMYTAPAYFMFVIISATIMILYCFFQGRNRQVTAKKKSQKRLAIDERANVVTFIGLTVYDCVILGCMLLNVATKGNIASFETLGIAIASEQFGMESGRAGAIIALCGFLGVICLLNMGRLEQRFADIYIIIGGIIIMGVGIAGLSFLPNNDSNPGWMFALSMFLIYSLGYPIGHTAVIGMFSKSTYNFANEVQFLTSSGYSCRPTAARNVVGMVRISRVSGQDDFPYHVRLRR